MIYKKGYVGLSQKTSKKETQLVYYTYSIKPIIVQMWKQHEKET